MRYVAGLLFDPEFRMVALIHKQRGPACVRGRWNAIGGKIEPGETSAEAMRREFREEAGLYVDGWNLFLQLHGDGGYVVDFYWAISEHIELVSTIEDEEVRVFYLREIAERAETVPNLRWILPMAIGFSRDNVAAYIIFEKMEQPC